jgi:ATP-dependent protease ClpP protease subunit
MGIRKVRVKPGVLTRLILLLGLSTGALFACINCAAAGKQLTASMKMPPIELGKAPEVNTEEAGVKQFLQKPPEWNHFVPKLTYEGPIAPEPIKQAVELIGALNAAHVEAIILEMDTDGGDIGAGFSLMKAIESSQAPVYCLIDGHGWSMGFYILQSCDVRIMTTRSTLMAHKASMGTAEGYESVEILRNKIAHLNAVSLGLEGQALRRICLSREAFERKISGDWFMGGEEALKVGAVDLLVGTGYELQQELTETGVLPPLPPAQCVPRNPPQKHRQSP